MLNVVETSTKNILPLPFLFVDNGGFCPRGILSGGIMSRGIMSGIRWNGTMKYV